MIQQILELLHNVKKTPNGYSAQCPSHEDRKNSLDIAQAKDGKILLNCKAGCKTSDICKELGVQLKDLFPLKENIKKVAIARYNYTDEQGNLLFYKIRYNTKDFELRSPDGGYSIKGIRRVIYGLPSVINADTVFVLEGEKDCETLKKYGYTATCNFDGASGDRKKAKWLEEYNIFFKDKIVFVIPDNDPAGRAHAKSVYNGIKPVAQSAKLVVLPQTVKDTTEFFEAGHTVQEFNDIVTAEHPESDNQYFDKSLPLIRLSDVQPQEISWLWDNRFVNKGINLIVGMGSSGKTTLSAYIMAQLTTGRDWHDKPNNTPVGSCIFFGAEDDLACIIRPRVDAAGGNASKIAVFNYEQFFKDGENFNLLDHIDLLDKTIEEVGDVRCIFFDPLNGYLGKVNAYSDNESKSVLIPLQNLAKKWNITIFGLCHMNKKPDLQAVDRVMGSVAFVNTARAVWFVTHDKEEDTRYLTLEKSNYCIDPTNLTFKIIGGAVAFIDGTTDKTADDVMQNNRNQKSDTTVECVEWLRKKLNNGPELSKDIDQQAKIEGFSRYALDEAKRTLKVVAKKDTFNGKYKLHMPEVTGAEDDL